MSMTTKDAYTADLEVRNRQLLTEVRRLRSRLEGCRPPAQVITDTATLDALPYRAVVLSPHGQAYQRCTYPEGMRWVGSSSMLGATSAELMRWHDVVTVLWSPAERAGTE